MNYDNYIDNLVNIAGNMDFSKITLLTGRNAGGKSLIRKLLAATLIDKTGKKRVSIPHASQQLRTESRPELGALSSFASDSAWLATSDCTVGNIKKAIQSENADYLVIDEPEIGLGEELQLGLIDYLNDALKGRGVLIICHSRIIAKGLHFDHFINLEGMTFDQWINRQPEKISIDEFKAFASGLFIAVRNRMNNYEKTKSKQKQ